MLGCFSELNSLEVGPAISSGSEICRLKKEEIENNRRGVMLSPWVGAGHGQCLAMLTGMSN